MRKRLYLIIFFTITAFFLFISGVSYFLKFNIFSTQYLIILSIAIIFSTFF